MEKFLYDEMYNLEASYWWFVGKRKIIQCLLGRHYGLNKKSRIIDLGCGTGITLECLQNFGNTYGLDHSETALNFSRARGHRRLVQADIYNLPFPANSFDLAIISDFLEHLDDDYKALAEVTRIMKQEGLLYISVPALNLLWGTQDSLAHHKRRYSISRLRQLMVRNKLEIVKITFTNFFIFPFVAVIRMLKKLLIMIYDIEANLLKIVNLPIGVSIICVAKKSVSV